MIDWNGSNATVLLNPRIAKNERQFYQQELKKVNLPSHVWLATSGSTGKYKFVALSKDALHVSAKTVNAYLESSEKDIWMHCLPDFHVGGLGITIRAELSGSSVIKLEKWNPSNFHQTLLKEKATLTALVPTMLHDLVVAKYKAPKHLRSVIIGGAALERSLYEVAIALGWNVIPTYGLTECGSQVATAVTGLHDRFTPLSHIEIKMDKEQFVWIKSGSLLTTYAFFDQNGINLADPKEKGWLKTTDKGIMLGSEFLILGRGDHFVKVCGEGVNLTLLQRIAEELSLKMRLSNTVVVYPYSDARDGHHIHLICEGKVDLKSFTHSFNERVMPYEKIRKVHFIPKLPRSSIGKILFKQIEGILNEY